jgi:hypothetical protein
VTKDSPKQNAAENVFLQRKRKREATLGNSMRQGVGAEPRTFAYDEMRRLIERKPEFEKLFVARGLRHPQPEVRWRKKP